MKFVALLVALSAAIPLGVILHSNAQIYRAFWILVGAMPLLAPALPVADIGVVTLADSWVGYVYSLEVTLLDIMILAALLAVPGEGVPWAFKVPLLLFVGALLLSMLQAANPLAASFGVWQYARMILVMTVVARACRSDPDIASNILLGLGLGMGVQFVAVLEQRFLLGYPQTPGLFVHQNTLGIITHMVLLPHLALLLYGHTRHSGTLRNLAIMGVTMIVVVLTASRATIGLSFLGMATTYGVLALARLTQRKVYVALAACLALAAIAPLVASTIQNRIAHNPIREDVYDERAAFDRAASAIFADHPLGVGTNHYVPVARDQGYSERAGVARSEGNRNSLVHNAYLLTAAESGWPGLMTYLLMLATPLGVAFRNGWRARGTLGGHLLLGLGVALLIVYVHSLFEWIIYSREVLYVLFITMGMVFGLSLKARATIGGRAAPAIAAPRPVGATNP